jgi:DNA-binding response OmpR family regulator
MSRSSLNTEMFRAHCLLVSGDLPLRKMIAFGLRQRGHSVVEADDPRDAYGRLGEPRPDLLILDWPHADTECLDFIEAVRGRTELAGMRVLVLSARRSEDDAVLAFESGVDDYMIKPFSTRELFARVRTCLSRPAARLRRQRLDFGVLVLDPDSRRLEAGDAVIDLGRREFRLMRFLIYDLAGGFPGTWIGNGDAADGNAANDVEVTLVVEPGSLILGDLQEALIITRGSRIEAVGTEEDPIVMTSRPQFEAWVAGGDGSSGRGEWAGLALMGYAVSNECGSPCDVNAEGNIGAYGGSDDDDSSGELRYVVIAHTGNDIDGNGNELQGLSMFATGRNTEVGFIQSHNSDDDGIEFFGSTQFVDHIVLTGAADDIFDWGQGWTGGAQFVVVKQAEDDGERGIEADNDGDNNDITPISRPTLANFTMLGTSSSDQKTTQGILLRVGTGAEIWNFTITGFERCFDIDDEATFSRFPDDLLVRNTVLSCDVNFVEE